MSGPGMERRSALSPGRRALVGVVAVFVTLVAAGLLALENFEWVPVVVLGLWLMTTAIVGALIVAGRPGNSVGPLMMWAALGIAVAAILFDAYASYAFDRGHPDLPGARFVAWLTLWSTIPVFALFIHLLLRFPTGRLPSPRWRWVSRLTIVSAAAAALGYSLREGPIDTVRTVSNPLGSLAPEWLYEVGIGMGDTLLPLSGLLALGSLFLRYRKAHSVERQQMKWFIFAVGLFPLMFLASQVVQAFDNSDEEYLGFLVIALALLFVPVSMGIGILKHRLYDIDVVLNRALVYAGLSGVLGATYLGGVVLLQRLLDPVTQDSDLAIAGSTLAVAGLFRPARGRLQSFIDRRFYRRKYDAAETLGEFSGRLRDEVDLDSLSAELVAVVGRTMQPAHASLWIRPEMTR
ncbi:MAG TPA: hypothetical protein VJ927_00440 [Actinomycetota bacterium]|nr:hypothetical protein [Actinomycetota bacterium]